MVVKHHQPQQFLDKVKPDYVLYPVGYRNRYNFPANVVSKRYKQAGSIELLTSETGAIKINLNASKIKKPELYRESHRRFWHN